MKEKWNEIADCRKIGKEKYQVSERLSSRLILLMLGSCNEQVVNEE